MIQYCYIYLRCIIFTSLGEFNTANKRFTQVYYTCDFVDYTIYEYIKHKIIMLFLKYKC